MAEKGGSTSMVVDIEARKKNGAGSQSSPAMVVNGGAKAEKGSVFMMEVDQFDFVTNPGMSNHRKHSEQVRWEKRLTEASNSENEQNACEGLNGDRTNSVRSDWNGTEVN